MELIQQNCRRALPSKTLNSAQTGARWGMRQRHVVPETHKKGKHELNRSAENLFICGCTADLETVFKLKLRIPVRASWGHFWGSICRSFKGTTTPSMLPNRVEIPRQRSMTKKRTDQTGEPGILMMASVNTIKARPVPSTPWTNTHQSQCR